MKSQNFEIPLDERPAHVDALAAEFDQPDTRLERARDLILSIQQNGQKLGLDPSGQTSVAHMAASVPDISLFLALWEVGESLMPVDANGRTPAHVVALKSVLEQEQGWRCAQALSRLGVSFKQVPEGAIDAPIAVLEDWPEWMTQWLGWRELNEKRPEGEGRLTRLQLFLAFLGHRKSVRRIRRKFRSLP